MQKAWQTLERFSISFVELWKRGNFARIATVIGNFTLCCQAPDSSSCFSTGNLVFARINLKPAVLKNFVFDWEPCFHLCEVYRIQNLVGLELPIKRNLTDDCAKDGGKKFFTKIALRSLVDFLLNR